MDPHERRKWALYEATCRNRSRWFEMLGDFAPELEPAISAFPHPALCAVLGRIQSVRLAYFDDDRVVVLTLCDRGRGFAGVADILKAITGATRTKVDGIAGRWQAELAELGRSTRPSDNSRYRVPQAPANFNERTCHERAGIE